MSDKPKTPRHMVSLTPKAFDALEQYKKDLEKRLFIPVTFSQAVIHLISSTKASK